MRIIDCLETAHTRLKLLSKESNVDTIELKREVIQYTFNMMTLCFESSTKSHRLIAHLDNRQIEFYGNLKELAQLDERFFRCHNSFVINRHNIESIDSKERIVYFKNGENCFASVRNVKNIMKHPSLRYEIVKMGVYFLYFKSIIVFYIFFCRQTFNSTMFRCCKCCDTITKR